MLQFNEDQKAVLLKDTKALFFAAQQLHEWVKENKLSDNMAKTLPSLIESHFVSIGKALDYDSHLMKEHEERYVEIRRVNQQVRDLENQLASSKPIDGVQQQLRVLRDTIYNWWTEKGFAHVSEITFSGWGSAIVEFSLSLDASSNALLNDKPVSEKKRKLNKIQDLIDLGFELEKEKESGSSWNVLDTPNNRQILTNMIIGRFPSVSISKMESWAKGGSKNNDTWTIWRMVASIHDLRDIPLLVDLNMNDNKV
ncbi:hypothetical protein [Paenibacillus sp. Leaf72]|uniref:hypothetical protein n=1 Tax=Paenibacillus sp. Leaf72 TaxID=1736234 RepID=UPI0006FEBB86|nr:hypothetical protein [Paenibacillus sp. Leaf72]KQN96917.1 hypothetical protein ASF12_22880 [Paenibacillus sp. Leaf72]